MKFLVPAAAALVAAIGFSAPAAAAPVAAPATYAEAAPQDRVVVRERTTVTRRSNYRPRARRVCRTRYRNGQRIRTCRNIRRYR